VSILKIKEIEDLLRDGQNISQELCEELLADSRITVQKLYAQYLKRKEQQKLERERVLKLYAIETSSKYFGLKVAGIDEAGRGPLAGPVYAAAVILPPGLFISGLNDSKKVSAKRREELACTIKANAISWAIGLASVEEIEYLNILKASHLAMTRALEAMQIKPDHILVDGNITPDFKYPVTPITGGDGKSACIAAASILAKVERDNAMNSLAKKYPQYGFSNHKGYATVEHYEAIYKYGITSVHRQSFLKKYLDGRK
jgi:ribonuclease HII